MQIVLSNFKLWCNKCATKCDSVEAIFSPLAGVFPDHLPGCPGAAPRTEPPCWAVGPSAAASCRRPSRRRELPGSKAPARLPLLRPLTVECPHRLPGCPRAAPCLEPPSWAVRPSAAASCRRPSRWREPTEIRSTGIAGPFSLSGCGPLTSWICPDKSDACQDNSARQKLTSKEDREPSQVGQLPILCYSFR